MLLQSPFCGVGPTDAVTIATAALLVTIVTLVACWAPSKRAAAIDPLDALRCE